MAYKKANRDLTDEQFSENTTIDGTRIDKAIEDVIETHNNIPKRNIEAIWMPTTYTAIWSPSRPATRNSLESTNTPQGLTAGIGIPGWGPTLAPIAPNCRSRGNVNYSQTAQCNWFPFMASHNMASEVFPSDEQPPNGVDNEYRTKGYYVDPARDERDESYSRVNITEGTINVPQDYNLGNKNAAAWHTIRNAEAGAAGSQLSRGVADSPLQHRFFTATFPFYFQKPVIIMAVSVFAGQEHPYSYFNAGINKDLGPLPRAAPLPPALVPESYYHLTNEGEKAPLPTIPGQVPPEIVDYSPNRCNVSSFQTANYFPLAPMGYNYNCMEEDYGTLFNPTLWDDAGVVLPQAGAAGVKCLMGQTGNEYPGELWTATQSNIGEGTIQISIDNAHMPEKRELNNVVFNKTDLGRAAHRFNQFPTTNSTAAHDRGPSGGEYTDMTPEYPGGSTWGVWIYENDLNIPVPGDSRVRFSITNKGYRASQLFEWHIALTVLEMVEE